MLVSATWSVAGPVERMGSLDSRNPDDVLVVPRLPAQALHFPVLYVLPPAVDRIQRIPVGNGDPGGTLSSQGSSTDGPAGNSHAGRPEPADGSGAGRNQGRSIGTTSLRAGCRLIEGSFKGSPRTSLIFRRQDRVLERPA